MSALDPITLLLMVRESYAQQRRDLLTENCDCDAVTGELLFGTFRVDAWDGLCEIDAWLTEIDATLMEAGAEPGQEARPAPSNVIPFPARHLRLATAQGAASCP